MNTKPIQIEFDEWWFKGCFIQKQLHPKLKPYHVFKDTEVQETVAFRRPLSKVDELKLMSSLNIMVANGKRNQVKGYSFIYL